MSFEPKVGQRVTVPNPDGEGLSLMEQYESGTIIAVDGAYFTVQLDSGDISPYSWVVDDGVTLED